MNSGDFQIPKQLSLQWLSYAEGCFYEIDVALDYDKIVQLFSEGYQMKDLGENIVHMTYYVITTGFAPGGVVVVWVVGAGKQTEVGRYQGKQIPIPQDEIDKLDFDHAFDFQKENWPMILKLSRDYLNGNEDLNPKGIDWKSKLDNSPIPFGLWDSYRARYHWRPLFQLQNGGKMGDYGFAYFNGEEDDYFYEDNLQAEKDKELFYQVQADTLRLPIPKEIGFSWFAKDKQEYAGYFKFNEDEIMKAFQYLCGTDKDTRIEMVVRPNISNSYATVLLRASNGKEIALKNHDKDNFFKVLPRG